MKKSDSGFESRSLGYYGRIEIHKLDLAGRFINKNDIKHCRTCTVYPALSNKVCGVQLKLNSSVLFVTFRTLPFSILCAKHNLCVFIVLFD